jgi:PAS domain S-box-containing protein
MSASPTPVQALLAENESLRVRLREAEDALRQTAQRFELSLRSSQIALFSQDLQLRYTWAHNPAPGFKGEDFLGKSDRDLIKHKDELALIEALKFGVIQSGESRRQEVAFTAGGVVRHYDLVVDPIRDSSGKIEGIACAAVDISERKLAEAARLRNVALFFTLLEQAPIGVYVVDSKFRIRQVNREGMPAFVNICPLIGRDLGEVLEIQWGAEVGTRCAAIFRHTLETGEPYISKDFTEVRHDVGEVQDYDWEVHRVALPDGEDGVVCYFKNVSDRAQAERELRDSRERARLATAATGVGIWEWNVVTNTIRWDAQMFRIYGIAPTADGCLPYSAWSQAVLPEELPEQEAILRRTLSWGGQCRRDFRIIRADDGECRFIEASEAALRNEHGKVEWLMGTNLDVTERKNAEEAIITLNLKLESRVVERTAELRDAISELEEEISERKRLEREILEIAEREQRRIGQDLHDGLGQELAGIALLSKALADKLHESKHPTTAAAVSIAKYSNATIESARQLARGLYPVELKSNGLLLALEDLAVQTSQLFGISCSLTSNETPGVLEKNGEIHLYRIVQECISNAAKHGKATRITIESRADGDGHLFAVTDNGSGLKKKSQGPGMGMHLMDYRARVIGGQISVREPAEGGCRVECRLRV